MLYVDAVEDISHKITDQMNIEFVCGDEVREEIEDIVCTSRIVDVKNQRSNCNNENCNDET